MNWEARMRGIGEALDYEDGEWDMFELITTAYYGKQMYFLENNNIAYSRVSNKAMMVGDAVQEFIKTIGWDGE